MLHIWCFHIFHCPQFSGKIQLTSALSKTFLSSLHKRFVSSVTKSPAKEIFPHLRLQAHVRMADPASRPHVSAVITPWSPSYPFVLLPLCSPLELHPQLSALAPSWPCSSSINIWICILLSVPVHSLLPFSPQWTALFSIILTTPITTNT